MMEIVVVKISGEEVSYPPLEIKSQCDSKMSSIWLSQLLYLLEDYFHKQLEKDEIIRDVPKRNGNEQWQKTQSTLA